MEEFRTCSDCGQPFLVIDDTDALCDKCSGKLLTGIPFCRTEKNIWEDKTIKKQWQASSKLAQQILDTRCVGPNYIQNVHTLMEKKREYTTDRYDGNDPLLKKRIVIK